MVFEVAALRWLRRATPRTVATSRPSAEVCESTDLSARSLALAGEALAPKRRSGADLRLAQILLREALVAAVRGLIGAESIRSLDEAIAAIRTRADLAPLASDESLGRVSARLASTAPIAVDDLLEAESFVARLALACRAGRPARRSTAPRRIALSALAGLAVAIVVVTPLLAHMPRPWDGYHWRASSASNGFLMEGTLGDRGEHEVLFHTGDEVNPWVVVDMSKTRTIDRITIVNRKDCCQQRGLPLVVEVSEDGNSYAKVGDRKASFNVLNLKFEPRPARYVRIRSAARTILHLSEIQIP